MKKEPGEMTFKESFDLEKDEATKEHVMSILKKQGFTEKQINEMKMGQVWKICEPILLEGMEKGIETLKSMPELLERIGKFLNSVSKDEEKRKLLVTDKSMRKDLFEVADALADIETSLHAVEDTSRQAVEELKKKLEEKRRK